ALTLIFSVGPFVTHRLAGNRARDQFNSFRDRSIVNNLQSCYDGPMTQRPGDHAHDDHDHDHGAHDHAAHGDHSHEGHDHGHDHGHGYEFSEAHPARPEAEEEKGHGHNHDHSHGLEPGQTATGKHRKK